MANIKWTGIESWKYGLTARWYRSQYYGNDVDVDAVGYYNPTTNPLGHGGPTRPFATMSKINQDANIAAGSVIVSDSGMTSATTITKPLTIVGDGGCVFINCTIANAINSINSFYNVALINCAIGSGNTIVDTIDVVMAYGSYNSRPGTQRNLRSIFNEVNFITNSSSLISNCYFNNCSNNILGAIVENTFVVNCSNAIISSTAPRPSGNFKDYSVIIGTVRSNRTINGKTTGVTIEDFKIDGNYFVKSYSEVDLFGNASGSGATVAQLQTLFNNYFSPIYMDTWQYADLTLKPTAPDIIKFGGLNGTYIGALPTGYRYSAFNLYNTHIDNANSSNLAWDAINQGMIIAVGQDVATYRSLRISLPTAITVDPVLFFANLVYNSDGTAKAGVANQRIDSTPDLLPNNTLNQRVVYDYKLQYSATEGGALTTFKNFELNTPPFVDNAGNSNLDDAYTAAQRQKIVVRDFIIEFTLRRVIIE